MRFSKHMRKYSAGVTLIELAAAMTIASVAAIGLGTGITTIAGFFQDDWVTRDVRFYGYECMDYIFEKAEDSKKIRVVKNIAKYDALIMHPKGNGPTTHIQANAIDGLLVNGQPMLPFADFPADGVYRSDGQRIVEVESFHVAPAEDYSQYEDLRQKNYLRKLRESMYIAELIISVTTKYQGEELVEYIKFKRIIWLKEKYFGS